MARPLWTDLHDTMERDGSVCPRRDCWEQPATWSPFCLGHAPSASWRDEQDAATHRRTITRQLADRAEVTLW